MAEHRGRSGIDVDIRSDDIEGAVSELAGAAGVELVEWPRQEHLRRSLARAGIPRILILEPGATQPDDLAFDEAWVHTPATAPTVRRVLRVLHRSIEQRRSEEAWIDASRTLHRGEEATVLTPAEAVVATELLAHEGAVVPRSRLTALLWPDQRPPSKGAVDAVIFRLRRRCRELGIAIHAARGTGFVMVTEPSYRLRPGR